MTPTAGETESRSTDGGWKVHSSYSMEREVQTTSKQTSLGGTTTKAIKAIIVIVI